MHRLANVFENLSTAVTNTLPNQTSWNVITIVGLIMTVLTKLEKEQENLNNP